MGYTATTGRYWALPSLRACTRQVFGELEKKKQSWGDQGYQGLYGYQKNARSGGGMQGYNNPFPGINYRTSCERPGPYSIPPPPTQRPPSRRRRKRSSKQAPASSSKAPPNLQIEWKGPFMLVGYAENQNRAIIQSKGDPSQGISSIQWTEAWRDVAVSRPTAAAPMLKESVDLTKP